MKRKTWLLIILITFGLVLLGELFYVFFWPKYFAKTSLKNTVSPAQEVSKESEAVKKVQDPGVTWIEPEKLEDLKLVLTAAENAESLIGTVNGYYKIADLSDNGRLILVIAQPDGPSLPEVFRFKQDASGRYSYLIKHSSIKDIDEYSRFLAKDVLEDYSTTYQSLSAPEFLEVKDNTLKLAGSEGLFGDLIKLKPEKVAETEYGSLYKVPVKENSEDSGGYSFDLKMADATYKSYVLKFPFMTDDEVALITWADGIKNTAKFTAEGYANCGMVASNNMTAKSIDDRLKEAGKTNGGEKIYSVSFDDPIIKKAYENYKTGRENTAESQADFALRKPVFLWKNSFGGEVIFTGRDFAGLAECGKPVIYLYPEIPTKVSVKVAAEITKSEPFYGKGWDVLAYPSGKIKLDDQFYPYLFWEGQGQNYPAIEAGTVVPRANIESKIVEQLKQLGLNDKETKDFLEFWLPQMPNTSFVRLTWFGTSAMNQLAPLSINPKPDTLIRVFLDFEGLNEKINLEPQKLTAIPRTGFTVIEWGGLLR